MAKPSSLWVRMEVEQVAKVQASQIELESLKGKRQELLLLCGDTKRSL